MPPSLILALRHGEKPANAEDPGRPLDDAGPGLDERGDINPASLTIRGWQRAGALAGSRLCSLLPRQPVELSVLVPEYGSTQRHRAYETVHGLAQNLRVEPEPVCAADDVGTLLASVISRQGTVVVCWEHSALADFGRRLAPEVPEGWPDGRFDLVWRFTPSEQALFSWEQFPQVLLPGDL